MSLKSLVARLPTRTQHALKCAHWNRQIHRGKFTAGEPEFDYLHQLLHRGETAIDVGANVGQYTRKMSELVGEGGGGGHVVALEPMSETFALLAHNCLDLSNVTLLQMAASSTAREVLMDLPHAAGVANYYRASISNRGTHRVLAVRLDSLPISNLGLIKIDAEGHDLEVLRGAERLVWQFKPCVVVEADSPADSPIAHWLRAHDYSVLSLPGSPNLIGYHPTRPLHE